ncbi:hypothetical protein D3C76_1293830 [compost metagenome]
MYWLYCLWTVKRSFANRSGVTLSISPLLLTTIQSLKVTPSTLVAISVSTSSSSHQSTISTVRYHWLIAVSFRSIT